jgi:hypothetical protein
MHELKRTGAKYIAQLRALSEELSQNMSNGESNGVDTPERSEGQ